MDCSCWVDRLSTSVRAYACRELGHRVAAARSGPGTEVLPQANTPAASPHRGAHSSDSPRPWKVVRRSDAPGSFGAGRAVWVASCRPISNGSCCSARRSRRTSAPRVESHGSPLCARSARASGPKNERGNAGKRVKRDCRSQQLQADPPSTRRSPSRRVATAKRLPSVKPAALCAARRVRRAGPVRRNSQSARGVCGAVSAQQADGRIGTPQTNPSQLWRRMSSASSRFID